MSKMLMDVLPMIDSEDSVHRGTASVRSLRNLILAQDKKPVIKRVLDSLKKSDISRPSTCSTVEMAAINTALVRLYISIRIEHN